MGNNGIAQIEVDVLLMKKMSFIGTIQKVFGVLAIIAGAITCIGIISAIIGVPYIISGVKLFKSGSAFTFAAYSNDGKFLREAILNLASFWLFNLILIIAVILFYVLVVIVAFVAAGSYGYY